MAKYTHRRNTLGRFRRLLADSASEAPNTRFASVISKALVGDTADEYDSEAVVLTYLGDIAQSLRADRRRLISQYGLSEEALSEPFRLFQTIIAAKNTGRQWSDVTKMLKGGGNTYLALFSELLPEDEHSPDLEGFASMDEDLADLANHVREWDGPESIRDYMLGLIRRLRQIARSSPYVSPQSISRDYVLFKTEASTPAPAVRRDMEGLDEKGRAEVKSWLSRVMKHEETVRGWLNIAFKFGQLLQSAEGLGGLLN